MSGLDHARAALASLDLAAVGSSRWYAGEEPQAVELVDALLDPEPVLAIVDVLAGPLRTRHSLPLSERLWGELVRIVAEGRSVSGLAGSFVPRPAVGGDLPRGGARPLNADQTNTSVVLGEHVVAKLYRTLEPGLHPEVEAVAALDIAEVPTFRGALSYRDAAGEESALLFLQDYVAGAESGWDSYIERLVALCAEPALIEDALADAAAFGAATARLHRALASAFPVGSATPDALGARRAAAERRLEEVQTELGARFSASSIERLRADLAGLDEGATAPVQRLHGDLTVAQFLRRPDGGLSIVDFEGEPGRALAERAAAWTPAWDIATLLLSFENAGAAARRRLAARGLPAEPLVAWLAAAPGHALEAYGASLPEPLLRASLAEKQVTELLYASRRLPEWLYAPLEVLQRRWG